MLTDALEVFDSRFWDPEVTLCRDAWDARWTVLDPYRGINANMHSVEAFLAAGDATGDRTYPNKALAIAERVVGWARQSSWRIPEHFSESWQPDREFNADHVDDPFKPYGATVGHGLEWSRLLLNVHASCRQPTTPSPQRRRGCSTGPSTTAGRRRRAGFRLHHRLGRHTVVRQRMHWVVAEAIAAASALFRRTAKRTYATSYATWWDYAQEHCSTGGRARGTMSSTRQPSPATVWPGKPDLYHAFQATLYPRAPLAPGLAVAAKENLIS